MQGPKSFPILICIFCIFNTISCIAKHESIWDNRFIYPADSIPHKNKTQISRRDFSLGGTFAGHKSWSKESNIDLIFSETCDIQLLRKGGILNLESTIRSEFGFLKNAENRLQKNNDVFKISIAAIETSGSILVHSCNMLINTSLFDNIYPTVNSSGVQGSRHLGGFFNPGYLQLGYGILIKFWGLSSISASPASIRISSSSFTETNIPLDPEMPYKRSWNFHYGFNMQLNGFRKIMDKLVWDNQSQLFVNSPDGKKLQFDINNRLQYELVKKIQLRWALKIFSDLAQSSRILLDHELSITLHPFTPKM